MWKAVGKEGLAVKAPWPKLGEEDKMLTRQAKFLRDSLKTFRAQHGKAKKGTTYTAVITDSYPEWKVAALLWMQEQHNGSSFPDTFKKDLKGKAGDFVEGKKMIGLAMQFVSFVMNEVNEVGPAAMETSLPFDQMEILKESEGYIKKQLGIEELTFGKLGVDDETVAGVPDRLVGNVLPGKPSLWIR